MPVLDKRVTGYFDEKLKQEACRERAEREYEEAMEKVVSEYGGFFESGLPETPTWRCKLGQWLIKAGKRISD